jgi:hypothetical protein
VSAVDPGRLALKEWHVVTEAIARGDQVLTIRKGGIREKAFHLRGSSFWLFPSWEHEAPAETKRAWHADLSQSLGARPAADTVPLRARATVADAYEISDADALAALDRFHLWTPAYVEERLKWRPTKPLTVLVLRAEAMVEPVSLPLLASYGGCKSWVELETAPTGGPLLPSLTDAAFALFRTAVRDALADCGVDVAAA